MKLLFQCMTDFNAFVEKTTLVQNIIENNFNQFYGIILRTLNVILYFVNKFMLLAL